MTEETHDHEFWMKVSRAAHELAISHGQSAASYAAEKAERALTEGSSEEHRFWMAVAAANTTR
jgi:hypothetical protein